MRRILPFKIQILTFTHTILIVSIVSRPKIFVTGIVEFLDSQSTLTNSAHDGGCVLFVSCTTGECTVWNGAAHKFAVGTTVTGSAFAWAEFRGKVFLALTLGSTIFVRVRGTPDGALDLTVFSKIGRAIVLGGLAVAKALRVVNGVVGSICQTCNAGAAVKAVVGIGGGVHVCG